MTLFLLRPQQEMTVFGHSGGGGGFLAGKQVFPVNYEAEVSRRLLEASHSNDLAAALECLQDSFVDVNFVGDVCLKVRKAEVVLSEESPNEVRVGYEEFKTDVTALFLAVHNGNVALVRKLLVSANLNSPLILSSLLFYGSSEYKILFFSFFLEILLYMSTGWLLNASLEV